MHGLPLSARIGLVALGLMVLGPVALSDSAEAGGSKGTIRFVVKGVEKKRGGNMMCRLYGDEDTWLTDDYVASTVVTVKGGSVTCRFSKVKPGHYALAAIHDEDKDGELDRTLGIPSEGVAVSRDAHEKGFGKPDWEDAVFNYKGGAARLAATISY